MPTRPKLAHFLDRRAKRKSEALQGKKLPETLRQRVVLFSEIGDYALAYFRGHKRSHRDDESRMKRLKEWFGGREAESLTGQEMEKRLSDVAAAEELAASTESLSQPANAGLQKGSAGR